MRTVCRLFVVCLAEAGEGSELNLGGFGGFGGFHKKQTYFACEFLGKERLVEKATTMLSTLCY